MPTSLQDICILIPAYNPTKDLLEVVRGLLAYDFRKIIVVNDGSDAQWEPLFEQLAANARVLLKQHAQNLGKGAALKTGLLIAHAESNLQGVVTADADGQHLLKDIVRVAETLSQHSDTLVLGVRAFSGKVPLRSRLGNTLTRVLFRVVYGTWVQDTQTGLRGIPSRCIGPFLQVERNKFDYEFECLSWAIRQGIPLMQPEISTVYLDNNRSSHFNPLLDSLRIYYVFLRFSIVSLLSFGLDVSLFTLFYGLSHHLLASLIGARLLSASFNFYQNKYRVYQQVSTETLGRELIEYLLVAGITLTSSYLLIHAILYAKPGQVVLAKITADFVLFIFNFSFQFFWVFRNKK